MPSATDLEARFADALIALRLAPSRAAVAVSGGGDSVALAQLMHATAGRTGLAPVLVHVDHGIAEASRDVARQVAQLAGSLGLELLVETLDLGPDTSETDARRARWKALERLRGRAAASWIVTAHHRDDQVETVLMRFLRGSGPAGLAGMQVRRGHVLRPLLPFRRDELVQYLHRAGHQHWEDPANRDVRHDRAFIRHELLPRLEARWPRLRDDLARAADDAGRWKAAWGAAVASLPGLDLRHDGGAISVAGGVLGGYDSEIGWAVVRTLAELAGVMISSQTAERVLALARTGASGKWVPLGGEWRATNAFGRVRIERPPDTAAPAALDPAVGEFTWGSWRFRLTPGLAPAVQPRRGLSAWFRPDTLRVRGCQPGDRLRPIGAPGHRLVVRLMQEARVPVTQRPGWALITSGGLPLWLPGICRDAALLPAPDMEALRIDAVHE